jgi:hypothetical protein
MKTLKLLWKTWGKYSYWAILIMVIIDIAIIAYEKFINLKNIWDVMWSWLWWVAIIDIIGLIISLYFIHTKKE